MFLTRQPIVTHSEQGRYAAGAWTCRNPRAYRPDRTQRHARSSRERDGSGLSSLASPASRLPRPILLASSHACGTRGPSTVASTPAVISPCKRIAVRCTRAMLLAHSPFSTRFSSPDVSASAPPLSPARCVRPLPVPLWLCDISGGSRQHGIALSVAGDPLTTLLILAKIGAPMRATSGFADRESNDRFLDLQSLLSLKKSVEGVVQ